MKVKKYLSLLLAVVMIASVFSTTAFASESELPVNEVIIGGDSLEYRRLIRQHCSTIWAGAGNTRQH